MNALLGISGKMASRGYFLAYGHEVEVRMALCHARGVSHGIPVAQVWAFDAVGVVYGGWQYY